MDLTATRETLHRVGAHVLGRARFQATGRFGLRASPGGFSTPAFGDGPEVLRVAGGLLVRERGAGARYMPVDGASLRDLAEFAGVALDPAFSVGADTPTLGDVDEPLALDRGAARVLAEWLETGQELLDDLCGALPVDAQPAVPQLWPEHFDLGTTVSLPGGDRVNLGASPGDGFSEDPYLYVGPWSAARPGDSSYWNAPFGAVCRRRELPVGEGRFDAALAFMKVGLARLGRP
jgi:hypothetical protein